MMKVGVVVAIEAADVVLRIAAVARRGLKLHKQC